MTEELDPCPFCNYPLKFSEVLVRETKRGVQAECGNCGARGPIVAGDIDDEGNALRAWNTRPKVIPEWLKNELIGKTEEFIKIKHLDSYQEGYDDAINWILSMGGSP